uniref:Cytochrome c2 n=1 Tax=Magnetococcus massalia (strain MO-1) TaxID=451514 RepID=A0A1S7LCZ3_MAGMO|nr:Cytochrome c2 [Candidatus Magnetococcus massalia]
MSKWVLVLLWIVLIFMAVAGFWWFVLRDDLETGRRLAMNHCGVCHDVSSRQTMSKAPPLWGVVGRKAGSHPRYKYSANFRQYVTANPFVWDADLLDAYLQNPQEIIPGTTMTSTQKGHPIFFQGLTHRGFRHDLVAYFAQLQ